MSDSIIHLQNTDVDDTLNLKVDHKGKPVLIFVYADWCGYCVRAKPSVLKLKSDLEKENAGFVVAVDSDREPMLAKRLGSEGFPSFFLVNANSNQIVNISDNVGDRSCASLRRAMSIQ